MRMPWEYRKASGPDGAASASGAGSTAQGAGAAGPGGEAGDLRRLSMRFVGQVQGVGFRWTAMRAAHDAGCTGWVRNEYDGSVSMELQGTNEQIAAYFGNFQQAYRRYPISYTIDQKDEMPVVAGEEDFVVLRGGW